MTKEQMLFQMADHLIRKYGYTRVDVRNINNEVWLSHTTRKLYNLVRLSIDTGFDLKHVEERTHQILNAIQSVFQSELNFLDCAIDVYCETHREENSTFIHFSLEEECNALNEAFPSLKDAFKEMDETAFKRLKKKLTTPTKAQKPQTFIEFMKQVPIATRIFLGIMIAMSLLINGLALSGYDIFATAILFGAYYKTFIVAHNEWFRLITYGFIHADLLHLAMNGLALLNLGNFMERIYGWKKFTLTLLIGILVGGMFVFVAQGNTMVVGISAGLYAVLGVMIIYLVETGLIKQRQIQAQLWRLIMVNLMINLIPQVSYIGHLGGFVAGILMGIAFTKSEKLKGLAFHSLMALALLIVLVFGLSFNNTKKTPLYGKTDLFVIEMAKDFGLSWYASSLEDSLIRYYQEVEGS